MKNSKGPLRNIKILDLTRVLAGPYCTMLLADLGADVIKVEMPGRGDDARAYGPFINDASAYFMSINRNKRSIVLNLKVDQDVEKLKKLIAQVDVITENFKPGTMEKLGLGYEQLKAINPKIIYAATSGFGHTGPYSSRPAYDCVIQAMSGLMSITGAEGGSATRVGTSIGDISAGMFTAIGILAAINNRTLTGLGQKVDVAMLDCQVSMLENAVARYEVTKEVPKALGNRHPSIIPFETFDTEDGVIMIAVGNDKIWSTFCNLIGLESMIEDERFSTNGKRGENYPQLKEMLSNRLKQFKLKDLSELLTDNGVPNGPINNIEDVVNNEQVLARDMIVEIEHEGIGKLKMPGIPIKLSDTPGSIESAAPTLGQHTEEIIREFSLD